MRRFSSSRGRRDHRDGVPEPRVSVLLGAVLDAVRGGGGNAARHEGDGGAEGAVRTREDAEDSANFWKRV